MPLQDLNATSMKGLKALLKTLREHGVTEFTTPELSLKLETQAQAGEQAPSLTDQMMGDAELTPEQALFYSAPEVPPTTE